MTITRTSDGFVLTSAFRTIRVSFIVFEGERMAAIWDSDYAELTDAPELLQPFDPADLGRIAYYCARCSARMDVSRLK